MDYSSCIEQTGVIDAIENEIARVRINSFSACSSCHSKAACGVTETTERIMDVPFYNSDFSIGETVKVVMKRTLGLRAALIAYVLPFIIVLAILITLDSLQVTELWSGLISLAILVPYFFGLYYFRERLKKTFTFTIQKVN